MSEKVKVGLSKLDGQGLFAIENIKKDQKILHVKGEVIGLTKFFKSSQKARDNMFRFSENRYLDPCGQLGDYLNHSCEPNCRVVKKGNNLFLVAIKNIRKNQEVLLDYATILAKDDFWLKKCNCQTKSCRGKMKRYNTLPAKTLNKYLGAGIIPSYILNIEWEGTKKIFV